VTSLQCITEELLLLLARLKQADAEIEAAGRGGAGESRLNPNVDNAVGQRGGRDSSSASSGDRFGLDKEGRLNAKGGKVAKVLLTIAMLDRKRGMLRDALVHSRRARDLLRFAPYSLQLIREREKSLELVRALEAAIEGELHELHELQGGQGGDAREERRTSQQI
jgi:hypothetical protein